MKDGRKPVLEAWLTAAVDLFHFIKNKGSKETTLNEAARNKKDALLKATKKDFNLLRREISPGEELGGLTPNHRV